MPNSPKPSSRRLLPLVVGVVAALLLVGAAAIYWVGNPARSTATQAASIGGPFTLTNAQGKSVTNADFRGRYMLVYFGYTFCPDVCPTTLNDVAQAIDKLGPKADRLQPLFITVDPARDTPAIMSQYTACVLPAARRADRHPGSDRHRGEGISRLLRAAPHRSQSRRLPDGS